MRASVSVVALTGLAVVLLVVPIYRVSDQVIYLAVIADLITIGVIVREWRALWAAAALATCSCVVWYVQFFTSYADDGLLDGLVIGLLVLAVAGLVRVGARAVVAVRAYRFSWPLHRPGRTAGIGLTACA